MTISDDGIMSESGANSGGSSFGSSAVSSGLDTGGNLASNLITGMVNQYYQKENRNYQTNLANTAHQREVADLRAAGLNPILSATGGRGADVPSSGPATMPASDIHPAASFWSAKNSAAQISNLEKQGTLIDAQANRENSAASLNNAIETKTGFDQIKTIADTKVSSAQQQVLMKDLLIKTYEAAKAKVTKGIYEAVDKPIEAVKGVIEHPIDKAVELFHNFNPNKVNIQMPDTSEYQKVPLQWQTNAQHQPLRGR